MFNLTGTFTFPADEAALQDHFPDSPVIPGTLIIHSFVQALRTRMPEAMLSASRFRFKEFITPASYQYSIEQTPSGFSCTLFSKGKKAVTGRLNILTRGDANG